MDPDPAQSSVLREKHIEEEFIEKLTNLKYTYRYDIRNRAALVHEYGRYAIHKPVEMVEDNKILFRRILNDFLTRFQFALPELLPAAALPAAQAPAPPAP